MKLKLRLFGEVLPNDLRLKARWNKSRRVINKSSKRTRLSRRRPDDDDDCPSLQKFSKSDDDLVVKTNVRKLSKLLKEAQHLHLSFSTEVGSELDKEVVVDDNGADKPVPESTTVSVSPVSPPQKY